VEHERIDVPAQCRDDEGNTLAHQARDESDVTAEPIQPCDAYGGFGALRLFQGGPELRTLIQRISAFPGLDLGVFGGDGETFRLGESGKRRALRFKTKTGTALRAVLTR
jgi:hypothetical protein